MKHGWLTALFLGLTLLSTTAMTGCCGKKTSGGTSSGTTTGTSTAVIGATGEVVNITEAGLKFNVPGGWLPAPAGDWKLYKTSDNQARLGLVTFTQPRESTARIGQIASTLGLSIPGGDWRPTADRAVGPNQLRISNAGETRPGSCKTLKTNEDCYAWYATVDSGNSTQLLVVYAVVNSAQSKHLPNARAAVQSISKM